MFILRVGRTASKTNIFGVGRYGMKYRVYSYDLWGNEEDGYEVNDVMETNVVINVNFSKDDRHIVRQVKNKYIRYKDYTVDGEEGYCLYVNYKDVPYCELRPEE